MKLYVIQTMDCVDDGNFKITWHKHFYLFKEEAFQEALKIGESAVVLELTNTKSWNNEQIKRQE